MGDLTKVNKIKGLIIVLMSKSMPDKNNETSVHNPVTFVYSGGTVMLRLPRNFLWQNKIIGL